MVKRAAWASSDQRQVPISRRLRMPQIGGIEDVQSTTEDSAAQPAGIVEHLVRDDLDRKAVSGRWRAARALRALARS